MDESYAKALDQQQGITIPVIFNLFRKISSLILIWIVFVLHSFNFSFRMERRSRAMSNYSLKEKLLLMISLRSKKFNPIMLKNTNLGNFHSQETISIMLQ